MYLLIRERNAWKQQSYYSLIDLNKQRGESINLLLEFQKLANEYYRACMADAPVVGNAKYFAASMYFLYFIDEYKVDGNKLNARGHIFTDVRLCLNRAISIAKMKSALSSIRKKENKLYRNFEAVFLKKKR